MKKSFITSLTVITLVLPSAAVHAKTPKLPFVGTKYFNFMGGSATGQSITIKKDGSTTILFHGMGGDVVEYKGKFQNPIPLKYEDGTRYYYEIKGNQIRDLDENKKLGCTMKQDDDFCIAELD